MRIARSTACRAARPPRRRLGAALADERGSFIVEALVAASLLVVLALGFLAALDSAARQSGNLKSRATAASLAQDDMERLRAMKVSDVGNLNTSRTVTLSGITYTITSRTEWVDDSTGATTCPSGATRTDYLRATSTVTWPVMGTTKPVVNQSLIAVPLGTFDATNGGLIVRTVDAQGNGIPNIAVTISGTSTSSGTTDAGGCVFWSAIPEGGYYVDIAKSGYVDRDGNAAIHKSASVTGGATNSVEFSYDRAVTVSATFDTSVSGVSKPAKAKAIGFANSGMSSPGYDFTTVASNQATVSTGAALYPFSDGYAVWAGGCAGARPDAYGQPMTNITPTAGASVAVLLRVPAINLTVQKGGAATSAANVRITPTVPGCGSTFGGAGLLDASGKLIDPGLPYGDYDICADDGSRKATGSVQNRSPNGSTPLTLNITSSSSSGTCP